MMHESAVETADADEGATSVIMGGTMSTTQLDETVRDITSVSIAPLPSAAVMRV